jgi:hypothetical protein
MENLPVERLVRKALRAEEPIGRPDIRQLGIPQGAKRLEERLNSLVFTERSGVKIQCSDLLWGFI